MLRGILLLMVILLVLVPVAQATSQQALGNAKTVAAYLGNHSYILHGERWVYEDAEIKVTRRVTSGFNPDVLTEEIIVRTKPDGVLVGKWVDGVEFTYTPGAWEIHLSDVAGGI